MSDQETYEIPVYKLQLVRESTITAKPIKNSSDVAEFVQDIAISDREQMIAVFLNTKHHPIGRHTISIGTLNGSNLLLTIPAGTQNGRVFRLTGQGLPRFGAEGRGDLRVRTKVVLPTFLDDEGQELAQAFVDHIEQSDPRHEPGARSR